jgi:hypothetical protein
MITQILKNSTQLLGTIFFFLLISCTNKITDKKSEPKFPDFSSDPTRKNVVDSLKYLIPILDTVFFNDTKFRKIGDDKLFAENKDKIKLLDKQNIIIVGNIIRKHKWLGIKDIGYIGYVAITMTIQHSPLDSQIKFSPIIEDAFYNNKVAPATYSLLVDRIQTLQKHYQVYGSQVMYSKKLKKSVVFPILNPDSLENRRRKINIQQSFADYLKMMNLTWDIELYKKDLPILIEEFGVK